MKVSFDSGARTLSKGLRTSDPKTAALGAAVLALAYIRNQRQTESLTHVVRLRPGQSLEVVVVRDEPSHRRARASRHAVSDGAEG
jgi:hypothetical protein